jgi:uncharacterized membrane protein
MNSSAIQNPDKRVWAISGSPVARASGFVIAISFAVIVPMLIWGVPSNLDLSNHFRFTLPFYDGIAAGTPYPGWLAESNDGYGDPSFRFYPPALYYVLAAARFAFGNWYDATIATFALLSIAGGLGMYFWANSILRDSSRAAWAGFFYALAPYHVNQLYQATMLAEWAGSAILPFCFAFVERVCENGRRRDIAGLAVAYGTLVFTHLPLAVIGSLALLVYALVRISGPGKLAQLTKLALGVTLGLAATAIYWVTMISEVRWIRVNDVEPIASVDYRLNFLLSTFSPDNLNVWWMNILTLMTLLLCAPILLFFKRDAALQRRLARPAIILTAFAVFMSSPLSRPIWNVFPPLQETQFPWRWLSIVSIGISLLAAVSLPLLIENTNRIKRIVIFGAMSISIAFTLSHIMREAKYLTPLKFANTLADVRGTSSVNYWIPIWAGSNPRSMNSEVEALAARAVTVTSWQPQHRQFSVAAGAATEVRVKTFYYPHWTATANGTILPARPDADGALLISVPADATTVNLDFREPSRTRVAGVMSLAGLLFTGALAIPRNWRRRR